MADRYGELFASGYEYGPAFRGLRAAWSVGDVRYAEVAMQDPAGGTAALLDACLHLRLGVAVRPRTAT